MTVGDRRWMLIDLPGTYSLAPRSPDEMVAIDVLLGRREDVPTPDVVLCVIDASNLERNLYLFSQVLELGRTTVVALTMTDVALTRGMEVDAARLGRNLGVAVVPVRADRQTGLEALKAALADAAGRPTPSRESPLPEPFQGEVALLEAALAAVPSPHQPHHEGKRAPALPRYLIERLLLDTGSYFEGHLLTGDHQPLRDELKASRVRLAEQGCPIPAVEAVARYGWVARVIEGVVARPGEPTVTTSDRIDAVLTHRLWGTLLLAATMLLIFNAIFTWAEVPMNWIEAGFKGLSGLVGSHLAEGPLRRSWPRGSSAASARW